MPRCFARSRLPWLALAGLALALGGCSEAAPSVERSGVILARDVPALLFHLESSTRWESRTYAVVGKDPEAYRWLAGTVASEDITLLVDRESQRIRLRASIGLAEGRPARADAAVGELAADYARLIEVVPSLPAWSVLQEDRINTLDRDGGDTVLLVVAIAAVLGIPLLVVVMLFIVLPILVASRTGPDPQPDRGLPPIGGRRPWRDRG